MQPGLHTKGRGSVEGTRQLGDEVRGGFGAITLAREEKGLRGKGVLRSFPQPWLGSSVG